MNEQKPEENPYEASSTSSVEHAPLPGRKRLTAGHWLVAVMRAIVIGLLMFVMFVVTSWGGFVLLINTEWYVWERDTVAVWLFSMVAGLLVVVFTGGLIARRYLRSR